MPSRFAFFARPEDITKRYGIKNIELEFYPYYNLKPTNRATGMIFDQEENQNKAVRLRWGFIKGQQFYKARGESIHEKRMFKKAFHERRCLIFANGFFEWDKQGSKRIPYYFTKKDRELMTYAGVYNSYIDEEDNQKRYRFAIITVEANPLVAKIFHRMPAVIAHTLVEQWLSPGMETNDLLKMLLPFDEELMESYEVNSLPAKGDNGPDTIKPLGKATGLDEFF